MRSECSSCYFRFEREAGYFVGAMYISYGATVFIAFAGYFALGYFTSISFLANFILWIVFCALFPIFFFRYSRSLWLSFDYIFNPLNRRIHNRKERGNRLPPRLYIFKSRKRSQRVGCRSRFKALISSCRIRSLERFRSEPISCKLCSFPFSSPYLRETICRSRGGSSVRAVSLRSTRFCRVSSASGFGVFSHATKSSIPP